VTHRVFTNFPFASTGTGTLRHSRWSWLSTCGERKVAADRHVGVKVQRPNHGAGRMLPSNHKDRCGLGGMDSFFVWEANVRTRTFPLFRSRIPPGPGAAASTSAFRDPRAGRDNINPTCEGISPT
jgi:hypothetical protein